MAKHNISNEQQLISLKEDTNFSFNRGDIIVHKPFEHYIIAGLISKHFKNVSIFPVSPGTSVYTLNGYNTSVVALNTVDAYDTQT